MQYKYTTLALSLLAATGAIARPYYSYELDTSISVSFSDGQLVQDQLSFTEGYAETQTPLGVNQFTQITLTLGKDVVNQNLRCQAQDTTGKPIVVLRGANTDVSFGDGGKGAWTFRAPATIANVTCDDALIKIDPEDDRLNLRVVLSNDATETGSQTQLKAGIFQEALPVATSGPFESVELRVGDLVAKQDQRCQVLDGFGNPITVHRNGKTDNTFSDAKKGAWTFDAATEVSEIICDPNFVGASS